MEVTKESEGIFKEHVKKIVSPIFKKAMDKKLPQEINLNHTMVGKHGLVNHNFITPSLYNPHNYRLYFNFTKEKYTPVEGMVGVWFGKFKNYGKEFTATGEGIRVIIHKTKAEVINKLSEQEWFLINKAKAKEEMTAIINKIDNKCITSFKRFIEQYGGISDCVILKKEDKANLLLNTKCENKLMNEPFIDSIPREITFNTPIVKKDYKEANVEYKTAHYAAQHLENSALNDFAPQITAELKNITENLILFNNEITPLLKRYKDQVKVHLKVENRQLKVQNKTLDALEAIVAHFKRHKDKSLAMKKSNQIGLSISSIHKLMNMQL